MDRRKRIIRILVTLFAVLIGFSGWLAWHVFRKEQLTPAVIVVASEAAPASLTSQASLQTISDLLADQGFAVSKPGSVVILGSPNAPYLRAVFTAIDQTHPTRLFLIGLPRYQASTLYFHTRAKNLSVFVNAQPSAIAGPLGLVSAVQIAVNYQPLDRLHRTGGRQTASLPSEARPEDTSQLPAPPAAASIDLSKVPPVGDQGDENSCTGWSVSYYYKTFQEARKRKWSVTDPSHQFSPSFLYNQLNGGKNQSVSFVEALRLMKRQGDVPLEAFPYTAGDYLTQPPVNLVSVANAYKVAGFWHLYDDLNALQRRQLNLRRLKQWLAHGDGFVFAMNLPRSFNNCDGGVYDDRSAPTVESHCMFAVGYDDNVNRSGLGAIRVVNSWGKNWGDEGYIWISYEVFQQDVNEVWTMHDANP